MLSKGSNVVIEDNVVIGLDVTIGNNVTIYNDTVIGNNVTIQDNVVIGKSPFRAKNSILKENPVAPAIINDNCVIGTSSIIYAGAKIDKDVFIADLVTIRERVSIGNNTIIGRGVAIENDCSVGSFCKIQTNAYITAFSNLGNNIFIAPGVVTSNDNYMGRSKERLGKIKGVTINNGGRIGANATILPSIIIYEDGAVGAGSVVTKNVEPAELVIGIPAKKHRNVPSEQLLKNQ